MDINGIGYIFVFQILPTIIFFSALTSILFYYGIIQIFTRSLACVFSKSLKISGAESLSVTGNIFLDRENRTKAHSTMAQLAHRINEDNLSISMFPEGTRS